MRCRGQDTCSGGATWDAARGCPINDSAYDATCTYKPFLSSTMVVEVTYQALALDQLNCAAKGGTWAEL